MKVLTTAASILFVTSLAQAAPVCPTATLATYLAAGSPYNCTENSGNLTVEWNQNLVPSYVGLNLLGSNSSSAAPSTITVTPGTPGFEFTSSDFTENTILVGAQAEVVHFTLDAGSQDVTDTTFSLQNASVSAPIGAAVIVGQELLCVGGEFTSLPTGLVTSVTNGLLGTGAYGCNGTALIGTVGDSAGLLTDITGTLGLPNLSGLSDSVTIQLSPDNQNEVDVIKLQALVTALGGTASDTGFGNTYSLSSSATPEPGSSMFMLAAGVLLAGNRYLGRLLGKVRKANKVRG